MNHLTSLFLLFLITFPIVGLAQEQQTVENTSFEVQYPIKNTLKPVDAKKETQLILSKTDLDKEATTVLKQLIKKHAQASNKYRKSATLTREQQMELKELETRYKFELKQLLGEDNYKKLLVVVHTD
ncbi:hypothetical protein [Nonlabens agnitus]|uniref:Uncharacterized protein n=1 Tax=Nonlabens agnitus TaxID=870484 RepID=A0A2S9WU99_9FLAO|nr:hypothetical protein [Nonlabens agnitus]PRP67051.1 hypothetical protein BST86_08020 [Nonlabens agnitus]